MKALQVHAIGKRHSIFLTHSGRFLLFILILVLSTQKTYSQDSNKKHKSKKLYSSIETDPLIWKGIVNNAVRFESRMVFRLTQLPHLRFGIIGYAGKWDSKFGRDLVLTKDFPESNWVVNQNGVGAEIQYRIGFGSERGGLLPGIRTQWNQFKYRQNKTVKGEANHLALTPQLGYQWFPFAKAGFYLLPWTGVQLPVAGTDKITIDGSLRNTRKIIPWATVLVGWELKF